MLTFVNYLRGGKYTPAADPHANTVYIALPDVGVRR